MKNKKTVLWFALIVTAIIPACAQQYDTRLNGTWKKDNDGHIEKNYSGIFECLDDNGILTVKGTYTTNNGKITSINTHCFGTLFHFDPRWYSRDEFIKEWRERFWDDAPSDYFEPVTWKYVVNGNKLIYTYDDGKTITLTLVSRDVKFAQVTDNSKKSAPASSDSSKKSVPVSSGNVSAFPGRWSLVEGDTDGNPEEMDLLKDGTGVVDKIGVTWKIENGRFYIISSLFGFSSIYNISGSTLTLTTDDGEVLKYKKK